LETQAVRSSINVYPVEIPKPSPDKKQAAALMILNPAQSHRLVAEGTVESPIFQKAYKNGIIIIARGITNAYVCEELFNISIGNKANQTIRLVAQGVTNTASTPPPCDWHVINRGIVVEGADSNVEIGKFVRGDVVVKGANAINHTGLTGTYASLLKCGTMGATWLYVTTR
jgi:hypothetical protein